MVALGTVFSIVFGILTGVVAAWRRGRRPRAWRSATALAFYAMPTQWLGLMLIFYLRGAVRPADGRDRRHDLVLLNPPFWTHAKDDRVSTCSCRR